MTKSLKRKQASWQCHIGQICLVKILLHLYFTSWSVNSNWQHTDIQIPIVSCALCIYSSMRFEETFEKTQWRKVKQVQSVWFYFASSYSWALRTHLKTTSGKSQINVANVTIHPPMQAIWEDTWKRTVEKSQTSAASVILHPLSKTIEETYEKTQM